MTDKNFERVEVKVILLGESGVGKTSIINRYMNNGISENEESTIGSTFVSKEIIRGNIIYKLNIWDTTGQERYHSVTNLFIKGSQIVILVYSIDSKTSFECLNYWLSSLENNMRGEDYILSIVGNKCDLIDNEVVAEDIARNYAEEKHAIFKLVSAKEIPKGINDLFEGLLDESISRNYIQNQSEINVNKKKIFKQKKKKRFC